MMTAPPLQAFGLFIVVFFPTLAFITTVLRLYSKKRAGQLGIDDICIVIAMVMSIGETFVTWMFMVTNFTGWHTIDIPVGAYDFVIAMKYNYAVQVLYNPILAIVKTSVLIFFLKFAGSKKKIVWSIHALNALNISLMVAIFLTVVFQCSPIQANWWTADQLKANGGHCVNQGQFYVVTAAITILTDILVLLIPFWIVLGLQMARSLKIAVLGIFLLGFIVTMVGVGRLIIVVKGFLIPGPPNPDRTYDIGFTTSAIETNLAIITACAPALKPLMRSWFPRLFSSRSHGDPYSSGPYASGPYARNSTRYGTKSARNTTTAPELRGGHGGFSMKDMKGRTEIKSHNAGDSEEEIMTFDGIMKTTDVYVKYLPGKSDARDKDSDYGMRTSVDSVV